MMVNGYLVKNVSRLLLHSLLLDRMDELETGIMLDGTTRLKCKGRQLYHYYGVSTFGEYSVVPEIGVVKVK